MKYKQSEKIFSFSFLLVLLLILLSFSERKKPELNFEQYVIVNKACGLNLHAVESSNEIVGALLNEPNFWKLYSTAGTTTFQLEDADDGNYLINHEPNHNVATFMASTGSRLWNIQYIGKNYYKITVAGTSMAITADVDGRHATLSEWSNADNQYWELVGVNAE